MPINFITLLSYVFVTTFTPGPSNISSASLAVVQGYKNTLKYQTGLAIGVFIEMALSGWISATLLNIFPFLEPVLRIIGAAYILYLAFSILKASYTFNNGNTGPSGLIHGLALQVLNPKLIVYAFTLFTAFLAPLTNNLVLVAFAALLLAATSFIATSVWAIFGTAIKNYLHNPRLKSIVNILLALSLVYIAITLVGVV